MFSGGNRGGRWYMLGSDGLMDPGDNLNSSLPFGVTDPNLNNDFSTLMTFPNTAMGAANVWQTQLGKGYPGLESLMRANSMTDYPGFSPADKASQIQNYRQIAAAQLAARAAAGDKEALEALAQVRSDLAQGKLTDDPTIFENRPAAIENFEILSQMPEEHQRRISAKAMEVGAMIQHPVTGRVEPWSLKILDHFRKNWLDDPDVQGAPATMLVGTDGEAEFIEAGHPRDPYASLQPEKFSAQQHVQAAVNLRRQRSDGKSFCIEYPFSHHFVRHVLSEVDKERVAIQAELHQKGVRQSMLTGTASSALEPAMGIAGALLSDNAKREHIASSMRDVALHLAEGRREKAEASLSDVAKGISDFFNDTGRSIESKINPFESALGPLNRTKPSSVHNDLRGFIFNTNVRNTTRDASPASFVQASMPRTMAALWVGRQKIGNAMAGPFASDKVAENLFNSKLTEFLHGLPNASAKARVIATSLNREMPDNFAKIGFPDLSRAVKDEQLQFRPVVLDVHNGDERWGRTNGLQAVITPGHVGDMAPVQSNSFQQLFSRQAEVAPRMAVGYKVTDKAPAMTIVGYAARARRELTMTDLTGKERIVPEGTRLLSGALLVRDGDTLTRYNLLTHDPGMLLNQNGMSDNVKEVFRFWDPHHENQQGGYAFNSEATIKDATGSDSTRSGSMLLVFDE